MNRLGLRVAKLPDRVNAAPLRHPDRAGHVREARHRRPEPVDERIARGSNRQLQAFVDVSLTLPREVAIRVDEDRAVAIDAASKEVGEVFVRNAQWTKRETFCRRQSLE